MKPADFSGQRVALLGAGRENMGLLPYLVKWGAQVTVLEKKPSDEARVLVEKAGAKLVEGERHLDLLHGEEFDFLFRSPGIPLALVRKAVAGLANPPQLSSAMNLFLQICPARVIGVTGTKGKGTTANYIQSILEVSGKDSHLVGNIGRSAYDVWEQLRPESYVVLELSSFQLEDMTDSPSVAVVLPVTQDHLQPLSEQSPNFHPSVAAYREAKSSIAKFQNQNDQVVFAADSPTSREIAITSPGKKIAVSMQDKTEEYYVSPAGELYRQGKFLGQLPKKISGDHLRLDAGLASAVAFELDQSNDWAAGLQNATTLPHRMEEVAVKRGVRYIDDSYATAPDAAAAALTAFPDQSVIWIGGGSRKGANFLELAPIIARKVRVAVLIGQEAQRLSRAIDQLPGKKPEIILGCQTMSQAVTKASEKARAKDTVLLSPACASKDMFDSAAQRGEQFARVVNEL